MGSPDLGAAVALVRGETPRRISVFDLDRTITRRPTYSAFLWFCARRRARWRVALAPLVLVAMIAHRLGLLRRKPLKERMQRLMLGPRVPRAEIARLAAIFAEQVCARGLVPDVARLIARAAGEGRTVMIATAAHRFYAEAIAARLSVRHLIATESVWAGDDLTSAIDGENCYGIDKALRIFEHLDALGLRRSEIVLRFYSDDASDLPSFEIADERYAVNPSPRLADVARRLGWPILRS